MLVDAGVDRRMVFAIAPSVDAIEHGNIMCATDLVCCCAELFAPIDVAGADDSDEVALRTCILEPVVDWSWDVAAFVGATSVGGGE